MAKNKIIKREKDNQKIKQNKSKKIKKLVVIFAIIFLIVPLLIISILFLYVVHLNNEILEEQKKLSYDVSGFNYREYFNVPQTGYTGTNYIYPYINIQSEEDKEIIQNSVQLSCRNTNILTINKLLENYQVPYTVKEMSFNEYILYRAFLLLDAQDSYNLIGSAVANYDMSDEVIEFNVDRLEKEVHSLDLVILEEGIHALDYHNGLRFLIENSFDFKILCNFSVMMEAKVFAFQMYELIRNIERYPQEAKIYLPMVMGSMNEFGYSSFPTNLTRKEELSIYFHIAMTSSIVDNYIQNTYVMYANNRNIIASRMNELVNSFYKQGYTCQQAIDGVYNQIDEAMDEACKGLSIDYTIIPNEFDTFINRNDFDNIYMPVVTPTAQQYYQAGIDLYQQIVKTVFQQYWPNEIRQLFE